MTITHGGVPLEEILSAGTSPEHFTDFSVNINPAGPSPAARAALARIDPASYPDPENKDLRRAISDVTGVPVARIFAGNGSTEIIHLLARAYAGRDDRTIVFWPTFGEYEAACRLSSAQVYPFRSREENGFLMDSASFQSICHEIRLLRPVLTFFCNPNNPTGSYLPQETVEGLASASGDGLLVLDEAYISFVEAAWNSIPLLDSGNVIVLRSLTKDHALPGLRLGYALCPGGIAETLARVQPSWSVNAAAQAAGVASLSDLRHMREGLALAAAGKRCLEEGLAILGLDVLPSAANFVLVEVGDGAEVRRRLLRLGFGVRDCASFGLPRHVRIAARSTPECQALLKALEEVVLSGQ